MGPGALCAAQDRAKVVRVGQIVAQDDERRFAALLGQREDILYARILVRGHGGDDALVCAGGTHLIELAPVGGDHNGPCIFCHGGKPCQRPVGAALGQIDLVNGPPCLQRLRDGVAPLNHALAELTLGQGFSFVVSHKNSIYSGLETLSHNT